MPGLGLILENQQKLSTYPMHSVLGLRLLSLTAFTRLTPFRKAKLLLQQQKWPASLVHHLRPVACVTILQHQLRHAPTSRFVCLVPTLRTAKVIFSIAIKGRGLHSVPLGPVRQSLLAGSWDSLALMVRLCVYHSVWQFLYVAFLYLHSPSFL